MQNNKIESLLVFEPLKFVVEKISHAALFDSLAN